ncbi:MAG: glycosyltransferase family 2 protein [Candidatus Nanoarchaeia archaeon]|nr:glycosyltransferase family 2 protein [Candidatus Nanoarchaeia archaeon]MDD5740541.1 glycosyltransferase family 2 protein [Candidatus Nanoarchaeia archaeon]
MKLKQKQKKLEGGLRLKRKIKKKPLITIITVVRNGEKSLAKTIKSVINQTARKYIEYIIIDGNSTDRTLDITREYSYKIDYWVSESDKGIYDAMNKGVKLAKGEYIQFLNADDRLYDKRIIKKVIFEMVKENADIVYGMIKDSRGNIWPKKKRTFQDFKKGKTLAHPATFMKKKLIIRSGFFDLRYKISADRDLIYKTLRFDPKIIFINKIITFFSLEGISSKSHINEQAKIIKNNFGEIYSIYFYFSQGLPLLIMYSFSYIGILPSFRKLKSRLLDNVFRFINK